MLLDLVKKFVKRVEKDKLPLIGVILRNKDEVIFKHKFVETDTRNIFSHSKSFTSILVGYAVMEGYITIDTTVGEVFGDLLDGTEDPKVKDIKLRHFLTMSSGFNKSYLMNSVGPQEEDSGYPDPLLFMLHRKVEIEPGSKFTYSNGDTYMALRMIEKRIGKPIQQYFYEKIFKPLNMGNPIVQCDPCGRVFGASGMVLSLENQSKIAKILLDPPNHEYFKQMKSVQIKTGGDELGDCYGFQFWITSKYNTYRADGLFGQVTMIFENEGLAISYQCLDGTDQGLVLKVFEEEILKPYKENMQK